MSKIPKKKTIEGLPFYCWEYQGQTIIKHKVFVDYFDRWVKILGKYNKLNYFDCYGGCGAYIDSDNNIFYGSPVTAAKIIKNNKLSLDRDVNLVVIEKDSDVIDNLKKVLDHVVTEINPIFINENFDTAINSLLDDLESKGTTLAPTFFFVDPFGYSIKISTIERIMKVPKSEVFINFMFNSINRSINISSESDKLNMLFGTKAWERIKALNGSEREKEIIRLYIKQTKSFCNYSYAYKMKFPNANRTYYYLVHLTNHYKGCSIMKSSFAKYNSGRLEYPGERVQKNSFFDLPEYKISVIIEYFRKDCWKNKKLSFNKIIELIIDKTPFLEKDIRTALKKMINDKEITRIPVTSKKNGTGLQENDIISFVENKNGNL